MKEFWNERYKAPSYAYGKLPDYKFVELHETLVDLEEGEYHVGQGSVIRFLGQKL